MTDPAEFQAKLDLLCAAFAAQLPTKIQDIEAAWRELPRQAWDAPGFAALHRLVHSLSGSAEIFGFPRLSAAARQLEDSLQRLALAGMPASDAQCARIDTLLQAFHPAMQAAAT